MRRLKSDVFCVSFPDSILLNAQPTSLVIASRESRLALWQAEFVKAKLKELYPGCAVSILGMTTQGDQILDKTLSKIGGKGLFVKELEAALADGRAHLAVHSCKDVPVLMGAQFALPVILRREDPRDAWVSSRYASPAEMPVGAIVGTSSLRREAQLRARFPNLKIQALRGNLDTRLRKLDEGQYDAIVLAAAGLKRLGASERIRTMLPPADSLPAVGQGALAIQTLSSREDVAAWLMPLADRDTTTCVHAERTVSRALGGSCQVPLAAYAVPEGNTLRLRALVASPDGREVLRTERTGPIGMPEELGLAVAADLRRDGADRILANLAQ